MAKRIVSMTTLTVTATADAANLVDATYPFMLQGGSATQRNIIYELYCGGQAGASTPTFMIGGMDSQAGTGSNTRLSGQTDAPMDPATAALAAIALTGNQFATLKPQRSASLHLVNLSFNAFGGIVRWNAAPGQEMGTVGASANTGEFSFSAFTGGTAGLAGYHMIYESL